MSRIGFLAASYCLRNNRPSVHALVGEGPITRADLLPGVSGSVVTALAVAPGRCPDGPGLWRTSRRTGRERARLPRPLSGLLQSHPQVRPPGAGASAAAAAAAQP